MVYDVLQRRLLPENAAWAILDAQLDLPSGIGTALRRVARHARPTSMSEAFFRGRADLAATLGVSPAIFSGLEVDVPPPTATAEEVADFVAKATTRLTASTDRPSFLHRRLDNKTQRDMLPGISRRRYNRMVRTACRLDAKLKSDERNTLLYEAFASANGRLARVLSEEDLRRDDATAAFVVYFASRLALRSVFTNQSQEAAFDDVSQTMLRVLETRETTAWYAIAHVHPAKDVVARLTDEDQGRLLGLYHQEMLKFAAFLEQLWLENRFQADTMVVTRGNDSSTWNAAAGAWNKLRQGWMALMFALGLESLLETTCPGKAMRVMAADVAQWHRLTGGGLDPNTAVWATLPRPWEVMLGSRSCTKAEVESACRRVGLDPERSGWTAPGEGTRVATAKPSPELVHGVSVTCPALAKRLHQAGVFSGRPAAFSDPTGELDAARAQHATNHGGLRAKGAPPEDSSPDRR